MVINGGSRAGNAAYTAYLGTHLQRTDTNERVFVREIDGVVSENLTAAFREMSAFGAGSRSGKPLYHANIDWRRDEVLTDAQKARTVDRLAEELGLTGQPRVVVEHVKEGREHLHVVWCRIDTETMLAIPDSHNFRKHEIVARELEREFGHERVQGAHHERDGVDRPGRCPTLGETRQAERSGIDAADARDQLRGLWQSADNGQSFAAALDAAGWTLAQGDRRGFVALDPTGEVRAINKAVTGLSAAQVRERLADLGPLPSVDEARAQLRDRQHEAEAVALEAEAARTDARQARPHSPEFVAAMEAQLAREAQERGDDAARNAQHAMDDLARIDPHGTARNFGHHAGDRLKSPEEMRRDYADMMRGGVSAEAAADNAAAWEKALSTEPEQVPDPRADPKRDPREDLQDQVQAPQRDHLAERAAWVAQLRANDATETAQEARRQAEPERVRERVRERETRIQPPENERGGLFQRVGAFVRSLFESTQQPEPQPDRAADRQHDRAGDDRQAEHVRPTPAAAAQQPQPEQTRQPEPERPRPAERARSIAERWLEEDRAQLKAERDAETPEQREAREQLERESRGRGDGSRERTRHHHGPLWELFHPWQHHNLRHHRRRP